MSQLIKIGIADDQHLFRKAMITLCNSFEQIHVVLEAANGKELFEVLRTQKETPDILLLDLNMPELDGIESTKELRKQYPSIKIIILTIYNEDRFILHLLECGANAYLLKDCEPEELEKAIHHVLNDGFYFSNFVLRIIHQNASKTKRSVSSVTPFTEISDREKDVLLLICEEKTSSEIADNLFISIRTVEGHRNNLLLKTGSKNTAGLVIFAVKNQLFVPRF